MRARNTDPSTSHGAADMVSQFAGDHYSRILNHGDYKLDASQVMLFDCLVGNKAVSQYIELEEERLQHAIAETIQQAVKARFAA